MRLEIKTVPVPYATRIICLFQADQDSEILGYTQEISNGLLEEVPKLSTDIAVNILESFKAGIKEDPEKKFLKQQLREIEAKLRAANAKLDQVKEIVE